MGSDATDGVADPLAPTARDLVPYLLHVAVNRINARWRDDLRPHSLTVARWQVLSVLTVYDGGRVSDVAQMAGMDQPVTTRVIDQMERDGLVERRASGDDGRVVQVWLTDHGRTTHADLVPSARGLVDDLLGGLDAEQIAVLTTALTGIIDRADAHDRTSVTSTAGAR